MVQELARRGVAREHISAAVQQVFGEGLQVGHHIEDLSTEPHATTLHGATAGQHRVDAGEANPAGALLAEARRRFERSGGLPMESRKRRLVGWLQRRGHRCDVGGGGPELCALLGAEGLHGCVVPCI